MLIINYPVPTNIKEVCVSSFCLLSSPRDFPAMLSSVPLINHQRIACTFFMSSPLIVIYKISCETAILQSIFLPMHSPEHLSPFLPNICCYFASNKFIKIFYMFGCFLVNSMVFNFFSSFFPFSSPSLFLIFLLLLLFFIILCIISFQKLY